MQHVERRQQQRLFVVNVLLRLAQVLSLVRRRHRGFLPQPSLLGTFLVNHFKEFPHPFDGGSFFVGGADIGRFAPILLTQQLLAELELHDDDGGHDGAVDGGPFANVLYGEFGAVFVLQFTHDEGQRGCGLDLLAVHHFQHIADVRIYTKQ